MSSPEDLLYSAEEYGKRHEMFTEIGKLKLTHPKLDREELYEKAYNNIMKTTSGIIIPDGVEGDYIYAKVISTGRGLFTQTGNRIPMTVHVGDTVVLHKNQSGANKKIKLEDKEYLLLHESEIVMVSV